VLKLAEKNGMDVGQLLQSWAVQRGTEPLGKKLDSW
jgi:glycerol 2-dehydrogenase (NADP+)